MADIYARQRQLVGSTADWAAYNIVLGSGEVGIERVSSTDVRLKVGDGTSVWSALPYASASSSTINAATQAALDAKLALAGGTMTGLLVLSGDPAADLGAVTKQYADNINSTLSTSIAGKLSASGGSLTGYLSLHADPTSALHAVTKQYADAGDALKVNKAGDTMTGALVLAGNPTADLHAVPRQYVTGGDYLTTVGGSSAYAGKVVKLNASGVIDSSLVPVNATYLGTVNVTVAYALSGTYTPGDYFAVSASGTIDASWTSKINGAPSTAGAGQFIIYNANTKWDLVGDTSSSSAISGKLDKSGGTMTGTLVLAADPTSALHAATKQYVDTMVPKAGGTMTGLLVLSADPSAALGAATKQYVDSVDGLAAKKASNLSDLANAATARTNLGATTVGNAVFVAADAAAARTAIGAGSAAVLDETTAAQFRNNTADKALSTDQVWSAAATVALTWTASGTTAVDFASGFNFTLNAATGNSTLGAPSNAKVGQSGFIYITQDTTPRTLAFSTAWVFDGGADPSLSTTSGAKDVLYYTVLDATGPVVHATLRKAVA